ncbi:reverse transcriptase domain-containing protein [Tanacetum coccineum]|uniref:Reverse transcriptase domain-containing protein n=1 Tax=Tanacetum coccineum TaxID=301880 RepID=A0ABQ4ZH63_9ASTR
MHNSQQEGKIQKDKRKPQGAKDNLAKESVCHHCKEMGHWRRNGPSYLAELKKRKNTSGACTSGNGMRAAVEAIGSFDLVLPRYPKETMGYYFVARNVEFFENNLMVQEASGIHRPLESCGSDKGLELIQEEDTHPSENTSEEQNEYIWSAMLNMIREYELGDLDEPPNYKVALSDPESDKWLEAMNTEMQSMKDNQVWVLVELPPNGRTVGNMRKPSLLLPKILEYTAIQDFFKAMSSDLMT